jgi:hypothetical protein
MGRKARKKLEQREKGRPELLPRPSMRRRRRKWIVGTLLALLVLGGGIGAWLWNGAQATPELAPRFNLLASTGRVITLDDYLGKQEVVLLFYMAAG